MAQNSCYGNDIKHVLMTFGTSSGNLSRNRVKVRMVQYSPKVVRSMIAAMAVPEARAKALWKSGGH